MLYHDIPETLGPVIMAHVSASANCVLASYVAIGSHHGNSSIRVIIMKARFLALPQR